VIFTPFFLGVFNFFLLLHRQSISNLNFITMKTLKTIFAVATLLVIGLSSVNAQEEESSSVFDAGADIYTSYIWRGAKFGAGPAFQPWVSAGLGNLEIGAWGSVNSSTDEGFEMDLYASFSTDFGLSITVTDYYFGHVDGDSLGIDDDGETVYDQLGFLSYNDAHFIEPMVSFAAGDFSITAAYMFVPGFDDGDMYFEAGYTLGAVDLAVGLGDGAYTATNDDPDGGFNICNISIGTSKEIKITDSFSLPLSGAVVLNPATEGFYITAGISL
jgi:hypothetical protein